MLSLVVLVVVVVILLLVLGCTHLRRRVENVLTETRRTLLISTNLDHCVEVVYTAGTSGVSLAYK